MKYLICGDRDSFLQNFKLVLDSEEWMRLPAAMNSIVSEADWYINNDRYLRIYLRIARLEIEDEFFTEVNKRHGKTIKDPRSVMWFLFSDCWTDRMEIVQDWFKKNKRNAFVKPVLKSVKITWFKSVGQFAEFIELISNPLNWDEFKFTAVKELDNLMKFDHIIEEEV